MIHIKHRPNIWCVLCKLLWTFFIYTAVVRVKHFDIQPVMQERKLAFDFIIISPKTAKIVVVTYTFWRFKTDIIAGAPSRCCSNDHTQQYLCPTGWANKRWRYIVTASLIGCTHTHNDPCNGNDDKDLYCGVGRSSIYIYTRRWCHLEPLLLTEWS